MLLYFNYQPKYLKLKEQEKRKEEGKGRKRKEKEGTGRNRKEQEGTGRNRKEGKKEKKRIKNKEVHNAKKTRRLTKTRVNSGVNLFLCLETAFLCFFSRINSQNISSSRRHRQRTKKTTKEGRKEERKKGRKEKEERTGKGKESKEGRKAERKR